MIGSTWRRRVGRGPLAIPAAICAGMGVLWVRRFWGGDFLGWQWMDLGAPSPRYWGNKVASGGGRLGSGACGSEGCPAWPPPSLDNPPPHRANGRP